jgi:hypothetical protein
MAWKLFIPGPYGSQVSPDNHLPQADLRQRGASASVHGNPLVADAIKVPVSDLHVAEAVDSNIDGTIQPVSGHQREMAGSFPTTIGAFVKRWKSNSAGTALATRVTSIANGRGMHDGRMLVA